MPRLTVLSSLLVLLGTATTASAQDTDDWDFIADSAKNISIAGLQFSGGVSVNVQCSSDHLNLILGGLPNSVEPLRAISMTRENGAAQRSYLTLVPDSALWKSDDVRAVRFLRNSGKIIITSAVGDHHSMRMEIDLPAQSNNLDRVLTACGYPLNDPRDQLVDVVDLLVTRPVLDMPPFSTRYTVVRVELSCIVSEGRLSACQSDHETPRAPEVGIASARRANGTRVSVTDVLAAEGRRFDVVLTGNRVYRRTP